MAHWDMHADLTGSGYLPFTSGLTSEFMRVNVTDPGSAEPIDIVPPIRYLHLGWWAYYEELIDQPDWPDGKWLSSYRFIDFLHQSYGSDEAHWAQGFSGFFYRLLPGVVATFGFYILD